MSLEALVKSHIRSLAPYEPGRPIEEVERELGVFEAVKLASNENPLGPSPLALKAAVAALTRVNRYPDGACFSLRARLSRHLGVDEDQLIFGCGADEILELLVKTFLSEGDEVIMPWPSFAMYPIVTEGMGATARQIPLNADLNHDLRAMGGAINARTKLLFLCNPNNPTGTSIGQAELSGFVSELPEDLVLVIDEAYCEYARRSDYPKTLGLVRERPATVILRTFSKIYGLAGLRVGYGVASPELVGFLERGRHPFNVNSVGEAAAIAALDDVQHVRRSLEINSAGIDYLVSELETLGYRVWPTDANFVLVEVGPGYYDALLARGVIVRPLAGFGLPNHVRITVGLPEENEKLVKELEEIKAERERRK